MQDKQEVKKPTLISRMVKITLVLIACFLLVIVSLAALLILYESEIKSLMLQELNKHLKAEVRAAPENIDLSIIKTFPDCALEFKHVLMFEALNQKQRDTLMYVSQLNLLFNVMDLWNKKYEIQKLSLKDGFARPLVLKNGKNNYTFWQQQSVSTSKTNDSLQFHLELIRFENFTIRYKDKAQQFKTEFEIKHLQLKGNFNTSNYDIETKGNFFIKNITQGKTNVIQNKELKFRLNLDVNQNTYRFNETNIQLNELALKLSGNFVYKDSLKSISLKYNAPSIDIASVLSLLPEKHRGRIKEYESAGTFYANGEITYQPNGNYFVGGDFGIKNGTVTYTKKSTTAKHLNVEGKLKFTNKVSILTINKLHVNINGDEVDGELKLNNFDDPHINTHLLAHINLENLQNFWPIDTLTKVKGMLYMNAFIEGKLSDLKNKTFSNEVRLNMSLNITGLEAQFKGDEKVYTVENCSLSTKEGEVEVHDLLLKRGSSDLKLNGKLPNFFNYLTNSNSPLIITGSLFSKYLKLEDFMPKEYKTSESNDKPLIPNNIEFKLNAAIEAFSFAKFKATAITGEIEIANQKAMVSEMKLQTMDGEAKIEAYVDNSSDVIKLVVRSKLHGININSLFLSCGNYGQTTLTDNNLKGFATATLDFSGKWNNRLESDLSSIQADCALRIERGELIDFKPLLSLSEYVSVKDLERIKFSSLQSTISIQNQVIRIPKTNISNSALNIDLWGTHTFNNEIDYHIKLLISEYLAKKRKSNDNEFGAQLNDPEDRRSAFILMTGTVDNPKIQFDKKGLKEKIKDDIKREKQTLKELKELFKEDLGLLRKDSLKKKPTTAEETFKLEQPTKKSLKKNGEPEKKETEDDDF